MKLDKIFIDDNLKKKSFFLVRRYNFIALSTAILGDFYAFDTATSEWTALSTSGTTPGIRVGLAMTSAINRVFIFGGSAGSG